MSVGPDPISSSFVVDFTTLSASQIIWNRMVECVVNSELEGILKAEFVTTDISFRDLSEENNGSPQVSRYSNRAVPEYRSRV